MPSGYRMDHYRRPTPSCAPGAITVDTAEVLSLKAHKPDLLLIDVWALLLRTEPGFGSEWLPTEVHLSLPDAIWLPNVGLGAPQPLVAEWFITQLNAKTGGNRDRALVFFCVADCWMSWNAAVRARELGYRQVYWYRDGTSGWQEAGQRLAPLSPEPIDG